MNEYILCGSLATVFSAATGFFTYMNLTWNWQNTSGGNKFGHEMDGVMGKMLGIPYFSKLHYFCRNIGSFIDMIYARNYSENYCNKCFPTYKKE